MKTIGTLRLNVNLRVREGQKGEVDIVWTVTDGSTGPGAHNQSGTTDDATSAVNGVREAIETKFFEFLERLDA